MFFRRREPGAARGGGEGQNTYINLLHLRNYTARPASIATVIILTENQVILRCVASQIDCFIISLIASSLLLLTVCYFKQAGVNKS